MRNRGKVEQSVEPQVRRPAEQETLTHAVGSGGEGDQYMNNQAKVAVETQSKKTVKMMATTFAAIFGLAILAITGHAAGVFGH